MIILISPGELSLKGKNRGFFEKKLKQNIRTSLASFNPKIQKLSGRFTVELFTKDYQKVKKRLRKIFGISLFAKVEKVNSQNLKDLKKELKKILEQKSFGSFAVRAEDKDPQNKIGSQRINEEVGEFVKKTFPAKVDLDHPQLTIFIDRYPSFFLFYFQKERGAGGLPVGTTGKVLCLLSGGIDSAVAGYLLAKRGCLVDFLHFHAFPTSQNVLKTKIPQIFQTLKEYTLFSRLFLAPYLPFQLEILKIKTQNELILFRRFLLRVAEALSQKYHYQALITGDNLGQVASQTLENLSATQQGFSLPIFRPLIGFDKNEIIQLARQIGTYQLSIKPYKDCCSLIQRHPKTKTNLKQLLEEEKKLPLTKIIRQTLEEI